MNRYPSASTQSRQTNAPHTNLTGDDLPSGRVTLPIGLMLPNLGLRCVGVPTARHPSLAESCLNEPPQSGLWPLCRVVEGVKSLGKRKVVFFPCQPGSVIKDLPVAWAFEAAQGSDTVAQRK